MKTAFFFFSISFILFLIVACDNSPKPTVKYEIDYFKDKETIKFYSSGNIYAHNGYADFLDEHRKEITLYGNFIIKELP